MTLSRNPPADRTIVIAGSSRGTVRSTAVAAARGGAWEDLAPSLPAPLPIPTPRGT